MDSIHEFFHVPGSGEFWSESHYLDAVGESVQVHARLGFYPNRDVANVFAYLVEDGTVYGMRDESIDPANVHGLTVDAPTVRFEMDPIEVGRDWRVRIEGEARRADSASAVAAGRGDDVRIDCELVTRARHEPFRYSEGADWPGDEGADRYEVATRVEGTATLGRGADARTVAFEGPGERDHSWGSRDWTGGEWLWISGSFDDGTAYNHLSAWPPGHGPADTEPAITNGFWYDGETVHPITDATVSADPSFSVETGRDWLEAGDGPTIDLSLAWEAGRADVAVDPFATTPVVWDHRDGEGRAVLNRSPATQTRDGAVAGRGFLENMTQLPD